MPSVPTPQTGANATGRLPVWLAIVLGTIFAVILSRIWMLEFRWFAVCVAGISMSAIAGMFIGNLQRFLLYALLFSIPLASVEKWLFFGQVEPEQAGNAVYSGAIGVGVIDFIIVALAFSWFISIFVTRDERPPSLLLIDIVVLLVPLAYFVSLIGAPRPILSVFSIVFLSKHIFVYFYVSRHVGRAEMRWFLYAVLATIALEAALAVLQTQFHVLEGLARDKGSGSAERRVQYEVPGIEMRTRAEGTAYDSHAFGLYMAMLLPLPILMQFNNTSLSAKRVGLLVICLGGVFALVMSFSRAAWLSFAISIGAAIVILAARLRVRNVVQSVVVMLLPLSLAIPWALKLIRERFMSAPVEIMTTRFEQWDVAWSIWLDNFFTGYGAGNYMEALSEHNFNWALELPVHNVPLWIGAETGLFGLLSFFGVIVAASRRFWRVTRSSDRDCAILALALLTALGAYVLDGLTDPLFREPVVFMMFWHVIAFSVALSHISGSSSNKSLAAW